MYYLPPVRKLDIIYVEQKRLPGALRTCLDEGRSHGGNREDGVTCGDGGSTTDDRGRRHCCARATEGGKPAKSVECNGVTVRSDRIAVAAGARFGTQLSELRQLAAKATAGASLLDIAESSLAQIDSKLVRMDALAKTAALMAVERLDGSSSAAAEVSAKDRAILGSEFAGLREDIDDIAEATKFSGVALL